MSFGLGVAAALLAPLVMTVGFLVWEDHWQGSAFSLNLFKCNLASIGFVVLSTTTRPPSELFPADIFTGTAVGFLILSSTIGIVIGDWTWIKGLKLLGARRVIVLDSLKPFLAALLGWAILGEDLVPTAFAGIFLTVAGVILVSWETTDRETDEESIRQEPRPLATADMTVDEPSTENVETGLDESLPTERPTNHEDTAPARRKSGKRIKRQRSPNEIRLGYALSLVNVVLDTYGAVLIKQYGQGMTVWEINLIRFGFAGVTMLCLSLFLSIHSAIINKSEESKQDFWYTLPIHKMTVSNWLHVSVGVLLVTFLTPSLSNYALFQIAVALALTLGSIAPLYSLPLAFILQKQVPTWRAMIGAVLVVAGVVLLTLLGQSSSD